MRKACLTIDANFEENDKDRGKNGIAAENVDHLKAIYRKYHSKGQSHQTVFFETIHDFSIHPLYDKPCSTLVDSIANEEHEIHKSNQDRSNCIDRFLRINFETATYYFDVFERNNMFVSYYSFTRWITALLQPLRSICSMKGASSTKLPGDTCRIAWAFNLL